MRPRIVYTVWNTYIHRDTTATEAQTLELGFMINDVWLLLN